MEIPVYLFTGFLEGGKTSFIREILSDENFTQDEKTLLLLCEEGVEELDEVFLKRWNTVAVPIEDESALTRTYCQLLTRQHRPDRVIVEYNGMWPTDTLDIAFPNAWKLYQVITSINAETFEMYLNNMGAKMLEHIGFADLVVFNRCTDATKEFIRSKNIRAMNPRATIFLEDNNGNSEDYAEGMPPPFDLDAPVVEISDLDYGLWYMDAMNDPARYEGKTVKIKGMVFRGKNFPEDEFVPGRFGMVCCADDVTFIGFICRSKQAKALAQESWVTVTAEVAVEYYPQYRGDGPVLYATKIEPAEKPEEELVYFN